MMESSRRKRPRSELLLLVPLLLPTSEGHGDVPSFSSGAALAAMNRRKAHARVPTSLHKRDTAAVSHENAMHSDRDDAQHVNSSAAEPPANGVIHEGSGRAAEPQTPETVVPELSGFPEAQPQRTQQQPLTTASLGAIPPRVHRSRVRRRDQISSLGEKLSHRLHSQIPEYTAETAAAVLHAVSFASVEESRASVAKLQAKVEAAACFLPVLDFGHDAGAILNNLEASFHAAALSAKVPEHVSQEWFKEQGHTLSALLGSKMLAIFQEHSAQLREDFVSKFEDNFSPVLGGHPDFMQIARVMAHDAREQGFRAAMKMSIPAALETHWRPFMEEELAKMDEQIAMMVRDRDTEGTWMLPPDLSEDQGPDPMGLGPKKRRPVWKALLLRAAVVYINYLQATQALREARKHSERRERLLPSFPLF